MTPLAAALLATLWYLPQSFHRRRKKDIRCECGHLESEHSQRFNYCYECDCRSFKEVSTR